MSPPSWKEDAWSAARKRIWWEMPADMLAAILVGRIIWKPAIKTEAFMNFSRCAFGRDATSESTSCWWTKSGVYILWRRGILKNYYASSIQEWVQRSNFAAKKDAPRPSPSIMALKDPWLAHAGQRYAEFAVRAITILLIVVISRLGTKFAVPTKNSGFVKLWLSPAPCARHPLTRMEGVFTWRVDVGIHSAGFALRFGRGTTTMVLAIRSRKRTMRKSWCRSRKKGKKMRDFTTSGLKSQNRKLNGLKTYRKGYKKLISRKRPKSSTLAKSSTKMWLGSHKSDILYLMQWVYSRLPIFISSSRGKAISIWQNNWRFSGKWSRI